MKDDQGRAILRCSECNEVVRVIDGEQKCDCRAQPDGYAFATEDWMLEFLGVKG